MALEASEFADWMGEGLRKIAIVRASRIGDFLLAVPALRAIHHAAPQAEIVFIGLPRVELLARRCQHISRFEPFPGFPGIAEQFYDARRTTAFLNRMQAEHFDLAVQMHGSGSYSNIFTSLLGARRTVGFCREGERVSWLDRVVPYPDDRHEVYRALAMAAALGAAPQGEQLEFTVTDEDDEELARWPELRSSGSGSPILVLHPGGEVESKRWAPERFALVGRVLASSFGMSVAVTGLATERPLTSRVTASLGRSAIDLGGELTLGGLGALIRRARLLITNDTAAAHIAYALGTPSVTVFGPQDPRRWGPLDPQGHIVLARDVACRPCDHQRCPVGHRCLDGIGVEEVIEAAAALLEG